MILRYPLTFHVLSCVLLLLSVTSRVSAQDAFDCRITLGDNNYDLTSLKGEHTVSQTRNTPPTQFRDSVTFNLCSDLQRKEDVSEKEQCPSGTRACLTQTNVKDSESDRITAVIPLAQSSTDDVEFKAISSPTKGILVTFHGPSYPDPFTNEETPQSFNIRVFCDTDASDPTFKSYDGKDTWVEWTHNAGCALGINPGQPPKTNPDPENDGDDIPESSVGSGIGYFFLLLLLAFLTYFGLGAYYNYSTYGASGLDLIPHRDFWREVPYMLRDVVSHLCSTVRPRQTSSRGGYIAV